jgi:hypothetical protein
MGTDWICPQSHLDIANVYESGLDGQAARESLSTGQQH